MRQPSFSSLISVGGYLRSLEKVARPPFCFRDAQYYFSVLTLFFYMTVCPLVTAWNFRHTQPFHFHYFFKPPSGTLIPRVKKIIIITTRRQHIDPMVQRQANGLDVTVADTYAESHIGNTATEAGAAANQATANKIAK